MVLSDRAVTVGSNSNFEAAVLGSGIYVSATQGDMVAQSKVLAMPLHRINDTSWP